ncbi:hypothetical protein V8C86DRAFT_2817347 [Haematococcus lacustris]
MLATVARGAGHGHDGNQDAGSIASCSTSTEDSTHRMLSTPEPQRCIVRPKSAQTARSAQLPPSYPASAQLPSHSSPGSPATQGTPASSSFFSDDTLHSSPDPAYSPQGSDHKPPKPPGKIMRLLKRAGSSRGNLVAPEPHVSPFTNLFQELSVEASRPGSAGLKGVPPRTPSRGNSRQPSRRTSESGDNPEGLASAALGMLGGLLRRVSSSGGAAPTASGLLRRLSSGGRNKVHMEPLPLEPAIPLATSSEHICPEEDATPTKLGDRVTAAGHSQVRDPAAGFRGASPNRGPTQQAGHGAPLPLAIPTFLPSAWQKATDSHSSASHSEAGKPPSRRSSGAGSEHASTGSGAPMATKAEPNQPPLPEAQRRPRSALPGL